MDRKTQEQVFTPYFSTKKGGTGLGLPIVKRVVQEHGGTIHLSSEPGHGTQFVILLPSQRLIAERSAARADAPLDDGAAEVRDASGRVGGDAGGDAGWDGEGGGAGWVIDAGGAADWLGGVGGVGDGEVRSADAPGEETGPAGETGPAEAAGGSPA
jgi:hypothetical protein